MKTEGVEDLISRVAQGEIALVHQVLGLLAYEYLLLPVTSKFNTGDARGTQRVTVPTMQVDGRTVVPVFTSEDAFSAWSDGQHHCLSLIGADVVDSVPRGAGMLINPGQPFCLELSPPELETIVRVANGVPAAVENSPKASAVKPRKSANKISGTLLPALQELFKSFPAVVEAFSVPVKTPTSDVVLGLLTDGLKPDQRFELLGQIAEISRRIFGNVGAVEVFDDLHSRVSTSWELFQAQTPFYSRQSGGGSEEPPTPEKLARNIEKLKEPADKKRLFSVSRLFGHAARNPLQ